MEDNLFKLHHELKNKTYRHSKYTSFYITDPKLRHIHKAIVRDRIVHHAIYRVLYPTFDKSFIFDSYSCRNGKGTYKAIYCFEKFIRAVSKNYTRPCFALKCDVRKFFSSVNHNILMNLIEKKIKDNDTAWLAEVIVDSFKSYSCKGQTLAEGSDPNGNKGMPIGNLTSQLFANIYLNKLDQFVKNRLRVKYYLRYCDDFIVLSDNTNYLRSVCSKIERFLKENLRLELHPEKISIIKFRQGIDFLGYVTLTHYRLLRTKTKNRMLARVNENNLPSYLGLLRYCKGFKLERIITGKNDKLQ